MPLTRPDVQPFCLESMVGKTIKQLDDFHAAQSHYGNKFGTSAIGIAADVGYHKICFFNCDLVSGNAKAKVVLASNILDIAIEEDGLLVAYSTSQSTNSATTKTSTASMVGRAIVGGVIGGSRRGYRGCHRQENYRGNNGDVNHTGQ